MLYFLMRVCWEAYLCNNIRALDSGVQMDIVFPRKSDWGKVVGWTGLLKRCPSFGNRFICWCRCRRRLVVGQGCVFGGSLGWCPWQCPQ